MLILTHAWLNLWDKHMTTGRINQVTILQYSLYSVFCKLSEALRWTFQLLVCPVVQRCNTASQTDTRCVRVWPTHRSTEIPRVWEFLKDAVSVYLRYPCILSTRNEPHNTLSQTTLKGFLETYYWPREHDGTGLCETLHHKYHYFNSFWQFFTRFLPRED